MRLKILIVLFTFYSTVSFSQSLENLKSETDILYSAFYNMDFKTILDKTYPKVFELEGRDAMLTKRDSLHQNQTTSYRYVYPKVNFSFSEIKEIEGKKFCTIKYNRAVRITFEKKLNTQKAEEFQKSMKDSGKFKSVIFEKNRNSFLMIGPVTLIAVADETGNNNWTFIDIQDNLNQLKVLSEQIKKELGF
jgi:hypothetical protein